MLGVPSGGIGEPVGPGVFFRSAGFAGGRETSTLLGVPDGVGVGFGLGVPEEGALRGSGVALGLASARMWVTHANQASAKPTIIPRRSKIQEGNFFFRGTFERSDRSASPIAFGEGGGVEFSVARGLPPVVPRFSSDGGNCTPRRWAIKRTEPGRPVVSERHAATVSSHERGIGSAVLPSSLRR